MKREHFFIFGGKECPENCKYAEQGVRHLHCKHCDWRTKKVLMYPAPVTKPHCCYDPCAGLVTKYQKVGTAQS